MIEEERRAHRVAGVLTECSSREQWLVRAELSGEYPETYCWSEASHTVRNNQTAVCMVGNADLG